MEKPITLLREEFIKNITQTINTSGLPAFVIEPILSALTEEIKTVARRQYENDKLKYEQSLKKSTENEGDSNDRERISDEAKEDTN